MKALFLLLGAFLILTGVASAQASANSIVTLQQMPAEGILLDQGWRLQAGDNPRWALPSANEQQWQPIDPTLSLHQLPQVQRAGTGWLRLRFRVSPELRQQALVLRISQYAASEIYLNGRLLRQYGTLSADPTQVRPYWPDDEPIELQLSDQAEQVLAVRFATWPRFALFSDFFVPLFFQARLAGITQVVQSNQLEATYKTSDMLLFGAFLLLSVLHLAFYLYNPAERANYFFTLYTLAGAISFACTGFLDEVRNMDTRIGVDILSYVCLQTGGILVVRALYSLFNVPIGFVYRGLWVINFLSLWLLTFVSQFSWYPTVGFMLLVTAEQLRLTLGALQQTKQAAGIIATGFAISLVLLLLYGFIGRYNEDLLQLKVMSLPLRTILTFPVFLSPVLAISLYLTRQFAWASRLLEIKLNQVRNLSQQMLEQQQEKQLLLAQQNETLERKVQQRTAALQKTLHNLQATQNQLIQREKMASLGELTAGIAHEIQNPLNFVKNFSEVATELLSELKDEMLTAQTAPQKTFTCDLVGELTEVLEKIHHHGYRAGSIVQGMLEHARIGTGERALTDLNALADEFMRLSYQGLRAKNPTFSAKLTTDFDPDLGLIEVVPQDMGRVLLNLFNNAFYAVCKRQAQETADYKPEVLVRTVRCSNAVQIIIRDNGTGIPANIVSKIYQPFFTTKPTGQGTGLGLSLSYDIITKMHKGNLIVDTQEGQYTEFTVSLPADELTCDLPAYQI
ncbi:sensor histidine kinase [Hymenobacter volaticus]|uniref:histidine kinase n=1 Tax=Hymenobacter volaticus TaxID=2932254 RepID=A0ABY4G817_9BACT|nr:ATP-binding protein [Hymenobacter volaticus]UOQ67047.1 ATP-binding protein [Hymenobacter volaticus]